MRKLKYSLEKLVQKWGLIKLSKGYTNYALWLSGEPVASKIKQLLLSDSAIYKKYLNINTEELLNDLTPKNIKNILALCSIELYFKQLGSLYHSNDNMKVQITVAKE